MRLPRIYDLGKYVSLDKAVVLYGPRQVGKTTLIEEYLKDVELKYKLDTGDDIRMEWGYVYYDATDEIRILAGRIRPALFLYSDYLDVGYAYTWITPPSEVYYQAQITNMDGGSVAYNMELGDNTLTLNAYAGNTTTNKIKPDDGSINDFANDNIFGAEKAFLVIVIDLTAVDDILLVFFSCSKRTLSP